MVTGLILGFFHLRLYDPTMGKLSILGMYLFMGVLGAVIYLAASWLLGDRATIRQLMRRRGKRGDKQ